MSNTDYTGFSVFEGELLAQDLTALKALVQEGLDDDTDAYFLFLSLSESLAAFKPR